MFNPECRWLGQLLAIPARASVDEQRIELDGGSARGGFRHTSSAALGVEFAIFVRKGNQFLMVAVKAASDLVDGLNPVCSNVYSCCIK